MKQVMVKTGAMLLAMLWVFLCFELSLWVISSFKNIYSIEMLKYAMTLKVDSSNPLVTHEHRVDVKAELMGVEVVLNSLGHRSRDLKNPKQENEKRIYVLGSSMTLGWGVSYGDTFISVLENMLNLEIKKQTGFYYLAINAGIGNYNTFYQVELFKKQVKITDPDLVILHYHLNDAEPNPGGGTSKIMILKHSLFAGFAYHNIKLLMAKASGTLGDYYSNLYIEGRPNWENTKNAISELKLICDSRKIPLVILLMPDLQNLSTDGPFSATYEKIKKTFGRFGIPMVNPFSALQATYGKNLIQARVAQDDPHPSAGVHRIIADELFAFIKDKNY